MVSRVKLKNIPKDAIAGVYANNAKVPGRQIVARALQEGKSRVYNLNGQESPEPVGFSPLKTPVFDNIIFPAGSYQDVNGQTVEYDELRIDAVLINVDQDKNIIRTAPLGRNGTVKRYVSDGDFSINIRGKIVNSDQFLQYPEDDVINFIKILKSSEPLQVVSSYLQRLEIFDITVQGYQLPQRSTQNVQEFQIRAYSDEPFDFIIQGDNG